MRAWVVQFLAISEDFSEFVSFLVGIRFSFGGGGCGLLPDEYS